MASSLKTLILACLLSSAAHAYFADWSALAEDRQPTCVAIPANMSLCTNIGYTKMRLPNLLEHDTIQEASQQAMSWVPLTKVNCAEDAQLFLCSLFAPVCLERPIYPCRSLCQKVKSGCEGTMKRHGYPWPSMLDCDKFPLDNDMCITSQAEAKQEEKKKYATADNNAAPATAEAETAPGKEGNADTTRSSTATTCTAKLCNQAATYQSILANYCQADFVVKIKFKSVKKRSWRGRKVNTVFKAWRGTPGELRKLRKPKLDLDAADECCTSWAKKHSRKQRFLVMGKNLDSSLVPTFIVPWSRDKEMRRARRMFKQIDCSTLGQQEHGAARSSSTQSLTRASSTTDMISRFSQGPTSSKHRLRRENERERHVNKRRHQRKRKLHDRHRRQKDNN